MRNSTDELAAASLVGRGGYLAAAISRAYYAAFYAAEAALLELGETRSKHSGVISAFGKLVVKQGGFDPDVGGLLRSLFALRAKADHDWERPEDPAEAETAIAEAERFVVAVGEWIARRRPT